MMDKFKKQFVINGLRRMSYRWPSRYRTLKKANVGRNAYFCSMCPEGVVHPKKNIQLDHIDPIVNPETGFTTFDDYIDRMFCYESGWQVLCKEHHEIKSLAENQIRKETRKKDVDKAQFLWHSVCMFKTNTSLFSHVSFWCLIASLSYLHGSPEQWVPTLAVYTVWVSAMVFHRIRRIDDFEVDLDDKSLKIKADND